jgi:hypothetical protein
MVICCHPFDSNDHTHTNTDEERKSNYLEPFPRCQFGSFLSHVIGMACSRTCGGIRPISIFLVK